MSITNNCMTINIHFGMWEGHRLDKAATQELTTSKRSASDAARVNKHLVDKRWLQPMISARSAIRNHHIAMTMPWKDNGDRLLPRQLYLKFIEEHSALVREFEKQKQEFLDVGYPRRGSKPSSAWVSCSTRTITLMLRTCVGSSTFEW